MSDVAPPATGTGTTCRPPSRRCSHTLRLQGGDVDTIRLQAIVPAAARSIELDVDRVEPLDGPPPEPLIQYELERRTIVMYQADIPVAAIVPGAPVLAARRRVPRRHRQAPPEARRRVNRLEVARDAIVQAIAPVLSGRVYPYPPSPQQAQMAPAVWIGQADGHPHDHR